MTELEWQVLGLLAQSLTVEQVARQLGCATDAVRTRRALALEKLMRLGRAEALVLRRALESKA